MGRAEDLHLRIVAEGLPALDGFILTRQSEELFLDFKRSTDNGARHFLNQNDRDALAKGISGFGNSEGGLIVWGVDCSRDSDSADVAHAKVPIENPVRFLSWLEGAVSGCTVPPHPGVRHNVLTIEGSSAGFVITYVPKSELAPHQCVRPLQYYMRAGSSFQPVPHGVLAGMFGRRPQPNVYAMFNVTLVDMAKDKVRVQVGFVLRNQGPGIASDLFMNAMTHSKPGPNTDILIDRPDTSNWQGYFSWGMHTSCISKPGIRLPPEAQAQPYSFDFYFSPPFTADLFIEGLCGCGQSPPFRFSLKQSKEKIGEIYDTFVKKYRAGQITEGERAEYSNLLLGFPTETSN